MIVPVGKSAPVRGVAGWTLCILFVCLAVGSTAEAAIYWANGYTIGRVNLDGSHPEPNFISTHASQNLSSACGVAVNDSHIYWADRARNVVGRANLDGSNPVYSFIPANEPCGVAVDSKYIYWANEKGGVGRASLDGTDPVQRFVNSAFAPCGVAVNDSHIYWASWVTDSIGRADLDGGNASYDLIEGVTGACGVTLSDTHVYWGTFNSEIGRANLDGSNADSAFIEGLDRPCGVAVDATRIFWTEQAVASWGVVGSAPLDGTTVNRGIVSDLYSPCGVAIDSISYVPPVPPGPLANSRFSLGRIKYQRGRRVVLIAVNLAEEGHLSVRGRPPGFNWRILPERAQGPSFGAGRKWLKVWADRSMAAGRRLNRRIQRTGRAEVLLALQFSALGKASSTRRKWLSLFGARQ